jgi:hypothetical protein
MKWHWCQAQSSPSRVLFSPVGFRSARMSDELSRSTIRARDGAGVEVRLEGASHFIQSWGRARSAARPGPPRGGEIDRRATTRFLTCGAVQSAGTVRFRTAPPDVLHIGDPLVAHRTDAAERDPSLQIAHRPVDGASACDLSDPVQPDVRRSSHKPPCAAHSPNPRTGLLSGVFDWDSRWGARLDRWGSNRTGVVVQLTGSQCFLQAPNRRQTGAGIGFLRGNFSTVASSS